MEKGSRNMTGEKETGTMYKHYDRAMNEGGEGYNPYTVERERRAAEQARTAPRSADSLRREIASLDCSSACESGTYDASRIAKLEDQLAAVMAEETEAVESEWTLEVTQTRRSTWNGMVKSGDLSTAGTIDWRKVAAAQLTLGWSFGSLKAAIVRHGL